MGEGKRKYFDDSGRRLMQPGLGEPPFGAAEAPGSLGALLRQARAGRGGTVEDAAQVLRIRATYLRALEEGRYKDLPGPTYALGFLRTYAEYLAVDPAQAVALFRAESSGTIPKSELYMPQPVPESRIPGGAVLLLALVLAGGVYGGWYYASSTGRDLVDLVPPLPDRVAQVLNPGAGDSSDAAPGAPDAVATVPKPGGEGAPETASDLVESVPPAEEPPLTTAEPDPEREVASETVAAPAMEPAPVQVTSTDPAPPEAAAPGTEPAAPQPATAEAAVLAPPQEPNPSAAPAPAQMAGQGPGPEEAAPPAPPAPPAAAEPAQVAPAQVAEAAPAEPPPAGKVYGSSDGAARIQLVATQDSWVQIRDAKGDLVFARVLRPGDVYRVPDKPGLTLVTGNAGGLIVSIDGARQSAPLGETGKVLRGIALDPQKLKAAS